MSLESKIMKHARSGNTCVCCGISDGTVCGRHYNGQRQHQYGKGRGIKCHPFAVADLCSRCDAEFQEGSVPKGDFAARADYSEHFLHLCMLSMIRRAESGVIG